MLIFTGVAVMLNPPDKEPFLSITVSDNVRLSLLVFSVTYAGGGSSI